MTEIKTATDPLIVDKQDYSNVASLLKALAGLGIFSVGAGLTTSSLSALKNRVMELPLSTIRQPSHFVQRNDKLKKVLLNQKYTLPTEPVIPTEKTSAYRVNKYREAFSKQAGLDWISSLNPANWLGSIEDQLVNKAVPAVVGGVGEFFTGANYQDIDKKDIGAIGSKQRYWQIPEKAKTKERVIGNLARVPGIRSMWFLPGATAAVGLGFVGGSRLGDAIDDMLGRSSMRSVYGDKAQKVYQKSVQYLQDVVSGKIKPEDAKKKKEDKEEEQTKEGSFVKSSETVNTFTGSGGSNFILNPSFLVALMLAGLTANQIKGGIRGYSDAKKELADRTHLQHAFQAAQKERDGTYNNLHLELDPEPVVTPTDKSLSNTTRRLMKNTESKNLDPLLRYENYQLEAIRNKRNAYH